MNVYIGDTLNGRMFNHELKKGFVCDVRSSGAIYMTASNKIGHVSIYSYSFTRMLLTEKI